MSPVQRSDSSSTEGANSTAHHTPTHAMNDKEMADESVAAATPARQPPQLGQESLWSPRIREQRIGYIKTMGFVTLFITIVIWAVMSIYWGSVWKEIDLSPNLTAWIVNGDSGAVGAAVQEALLAANNGPKPHSTWLVVDPARFPTQEQLDYEVTNTMSTWMIVEIVQHATAKLEHARVNGDASWDPRSLVSATYATSRNFQVVPSMVLSPATTTLNKVLAQLNTQLAGEYLATIAGNATAVNNLANAPQTIASPIVLNSRDLRPYNVAVAIAVLVVGLIYVAILAFNATMANFAARQGLLPYLKFRSLVALRIVAPLVWYFFMSLMVSLLNIAFEVPFGRTFSYGAGFMTWWAVTFVGMCVLGFVTECAMSLVGQKFVGFALVFWIILNVSTVSFPIELSPSLYKYGYMMPFYSIRQVYNKVIFDIGEPVEILKWFGILWAWLVVIFLTLPFWIRMEQRSVLEARLAQQNAKPAASS
ncbi:related to SNG1 |nr:related to SNG1 \